MNENKGAAEWLRGIICEYEANDGYSCSAMAKMFGIVCEYETCRLCMVKMMTSIADRIDLEMMEKERLKKENAELKAELDDWKGNAEGFEPDAYMRLPLDADALEQYCDALMQATCQMDAGQRNRKNNGAGSLVSFEDVPQILNQIACLACWQVLAGAHRPKEAAE